MTRAASTASPTSAAASAAPPATVAAKPRAPSTTTRTPMPSSVSSAAPSSRPSRRCTCWERIRSTRNSALVQPRRSDSPSTASRTPASRSGSRGSAAVGTLRIVGDSARWILTGWPAGHRFRPWPNGPVRARSGAVAAEPEPGDGVAVHSRADHATAHPSSGRRADPRALPISVKPVALVALGHQPGIEQLPQAFVEDTRGHPVASGPQGPGADGPVAELPEDPQGPPSPEQVEGGHEGSTGGRPPNLPPRLWTSALWS